MTKGLILFVLFSQAFIEVEASEAKLYQMPGTQVIPINDSQSDKKYELYVKLPENYSKNKDKHYPVIYATDAVWHIEILSAATAYLMEDVILVGISWQKNLEDDLVRKYGMFASRFTDYSFWNKSNPDHPKLKFGQASNHLAFIRNDVFKLIEKKYRTDPSNRSYFGYSLSGLFGAFILTTQPDTFKNYILGSPSVNLLNEHKIEFTNKEINANVFISHGTSEDKLREPIREFVSVLKDRNDNRLTIDHVEIEGSHQTAFPMTGVRSITWLSNLYKSNEKPSYTIAYSTNESGSFEIYLSNIEAQSKIKIASNDDGIGYSAWSPDGKQIAYYAKYNEKKTWSIHTMNSDGSNKKRLTHAEDTWDSAPAWSPDGSKIAFARRYIDVDKVVHTEIWIMNADGTEQTQIKSLSGGGPYLTTDSNIVFHSEFKDKKSEISTANINGSQVVQLTENDASDWHPEVSPNGKQIAFMSDRDGNYEIYVMDIDGSNQTRLTFNEVRDSMPTWSPDGSQILYSSTDKHDDSHIFIMNKDGSSVRKIISNGGQPAWLKAPRYH